MSLYISGCSSPVEAITMVSDGEAIIGLWLEGQKYFLGGIKEQPQEIPGLPVFEAAREWLERYFSGERPDPLTLPLAPEGSAFCKRVWQLLLEIPYGETRSYGSLAGMISCDTGKKMSARAVGGAVGRNPISIIIPCHRVIGSDGSLTGYAGGMEKKLRLLELEGVETSALKSGKRKPGLL